MTDRQSRRTTWLLAIWFLAGWIASTIADRFLFGPHVEYYADPEQPSKVFAPLGLTVAIHQGIIIGCLFVGWPICFWPQIARKVPFWETGWAGYLCWLAIWFTTSLVIAIFLMPRQGPDVAGGLAVAAFLSYFAISFVGTWIVPRLLISWLWLGAFAAAPDGGARENATDAPAEPEG